MAILRRFCSCAQLRHCRRLRPVKLSILAIVLFGLLYILSSILPAYPVCENDMCVATSISSNLPLYNLPQLKYAAVEAHRLHTTEIENHNPGISNRLSESVKSNPGLIAVVSPGTVNKEITHMLDHLFVPYQIINFNRTTSLSLLNFLQLSTVARTGVPVSLFIFQDFSLYLHLPPKQRSIIDKYCTTNQVGVVAFLNEGRAFATEPNSLTNIGHLPLFVHRLPKAPWGLFTARNVTALRITRGGRFQRGPLDAEHGTDGCCLATIVPKPEFDRYYLPLVFTRTEERSADCKNTGASLGQRSCVISSDGTSSPCNEPIYQSLVIEDLGLFDGVRRILFSTSPDGLWINWMLLFDAIVHLSRDRIHASPPVSVPLGKLHEDLMLSIGSRSDVSFDRPDLVRWVLIDVDDVFMRGSGVSFTVEDALAMKAAQSQWRQHIPGFTFNLGFCGQFFEHAARSDLPGYEKLLAQRGEFWWFDHLWNHFQPHKLNESELLELMHRNKQFAQLHDIPLHHSYAIAPHHSGVYPVVPDLYKAWRQVWNLSCTSTAHYPQLLTHGPHLGFRYGDIQVLPRQTCGIYSRFTHLSDFPGGELRLRQFIFGGTLFRTILFNPVSIFMTHMTNYKGDRLALYVFDTAFRFIRDWTNLRLMTAPPTRLSELYAHRFASVGAQDLPLYSDPCHDRHDLALWPSTWPCGPKALPGLLILGPQKTGSTALVHFLRLNPLLSANRYQYPTSFEELQFFSSDQIYARGLHWYLTQLDDDSVPFSGNVEAGERVRFEKSATYFASAKAPIRVHTLVPQVRLIVLLRDPVERAHSWYQHALAHGNLAAQLLPFMDVMQLGAAMTRSQLFQRVSATRLQQFNISQSNQTSVDNVLTAIRNLHRGCVDPGYYAHHLSRWLSYFPASQILPIDSAHFQRAPDAVLTVIEEFLRLPRRLNYSAYLEYNPHKGFHCLREGVYFPAWLNSHLSPGRRCLGVSKGRPYRHLNHSTEALPLMRAFYQLANKQLFKLFENQPIWRWWMSRATGRAYPSWLLDLHPLT